MSARPKIVVLDDYEDSLRKTADWKPLEARADVAHHTQRLRGDALFEAIRDADAIVVMADDSTLVAHKSQAQKIKELVGKLSANPKYKKLV